MLLEQNDVHFEDGEYGLRAVLTSKPSKDICDRIQSRDAQEIELNSAKGWCGDLSFLEDFKQLRSIMIIGGSLKSAAPLHKLEHLRKIKFLVSCKDVVDFSAFNDLENCAIEWGRTTVSRRPESHQRCPTLFNGNVTLQLAFG